MAEKLKAERVEVPQVDSVMLEGSGEPKDKQRTAVVGQDKYNEIAIAGGFYNPSNESANFPAPLDLKGLRILRDDTKADAGRRQAAGDRLLEIESILKR